MIQIKNLIKVGYTDASGFCVYTYILNMGRVILEEKIPEEHISLRKKHWINIINKIIDGDIVEKLELYVTF